MVEIYAANGFRKSAFQNPGFGSKAAAELKDFLGARNST
jgi:hypothetical protein